jgi:hypothetical protein
MRIATPTAMSATPTMVFVCTAGEASGLGELDGVGAGVGDGLGDGVGDGDSVGLGVGVSVGDGDAVGDGVGGGVVGGGVVRTGVGGGVLASAGKTTIVPCIEGWMLQMYGYVPGVLKTNGNAALGWSGPLSN